MCIIEKKIGMGAPVTTDVRRTESKNKCWDPKDGELYLYRVKTVEILLKDRSDTDVQIVHYMRISGRKTNRNI